MAYPGEGYNMSNYGYKTYTPEQVKEVWRENVAREMKISKHHTSNKTSQKYGGTLNEDYPALVECHSYYYQYTRRGGIVDKLRHLFYGFNLTPEDSSIQRSIDYFNNNKRHASITAYDQTFSVKEGYCQKLKREDLQHTQDLDICAEERKKKVPVLSNSVYGHSQHKPLEDPIRDHARVAVVRREFYRSCGTNLFSSS